MSFTIPLQLAAGQKVTIGYRPVVTGKTVTLINSNTVVPMLLVEEVGHPHDPDDPEVIEQPPAPEISTPEYPVPQEIPRLGSPTALIRNTP